MWPVIKILSPSFIMVHMFSAIVDLLNAIQWSVVRSCSLYRKCTVDRPKHVLPVFVCHWTLGQWCLNTKAHSYIPTVSCKILWSVCHWLTMWADIFCIQNVKFKLANFVIWWILDILSLLWPPNRAGHYILQLRFLSSSKLLFFLAYSQQ